MSDPLLLTTTLVRTFDGQRALSAASGFFFRRGDAVFLVTSRHVLLDEVADHRPNRIELEVHGDTRTLSLVRVLSCWLYADGRARWRQGRDAGGDIDVAVLALDTADLPDTAAWRCFTPAHLQAELDAVQVGSALLIVGFPLGFHDTVHHLPVVRQATVASAFGVRFQGQGQFLTDGRTHRGSSGGPVVMPDAQGDPQLPWKLLGVHASRFDMRTRDLGQDESLGLNSAWYADILLTLTAPVATAVGAPAADVVASAAAAPPAPSPAPTAGPRGALPEGVPTAPNLPPT